MAEQGPSSERRIWTVDEAGPNLDEIMDRAIADGPQHIVDNAGETVVMVSAEEWAKICNPGQMP